ncbi:MAG: amino acid adenylation domain-containing protein, partial [Gemmatimonadota bacterium]
MRSEGVHPLSSLQHAMALETLASGAAGHEILQALVRAETLFRTDLLVQAWRKVVRRHEVLRTSFALEDPRRPRQRVHSECPHPWIEVDVSSVPSAARGRLVDEILRTDRRRGFDLARPPLWRLVVVREEDAARALILSFHHAILDGWSLRLVLKDWMRQYVGLRDRRPTEERTPRSFGHFVRWLEARDPMEARAFWRRHLAGFSGPAPWEWLRSRPNQAEHKGPHGRYRERRLDLPAAETERLRRAARRAGVSVHTVVRSLWVSLLAACTGCDELVLGEVRSLRGARQLASDASVGLMINIVPVRVAIEPEASVGQWLRHRHDEWRRVREHAWAPLERVREWADLPTRQRLFETLFVYERSSPEGQMATAAGTLDLRVVRRPGHALVLAAWEGEVMGLRIGFDERLEETVAMRLIHRLRWLLGTVEGALDAPLEAFSHLPPAERHQVLFEWATGRPAGRETVPGRLERHAAAAPDAVALVAGRRTFSYGALRERVDRLAARLREVGVGRGSVVGVEAVRSAETLLGVLAILRAGGAYLPFDPADPDTRIREALDAACASLVVGTATSADRFSDRKVEILTLDPPAADQPPAHPGASIADPDDPAYVLFTSGSTGRPKPVVVSHTAVTQLVADPCYVKIRLDDVFLHAAPLAFDASTFEIWGPLLNGARLVLEDPGPPSLERLVTTVERERVTVLWLTAGLFHVLPRAGFRRLGSLRYLLAGGDVLSAARCREVVEDLPRTVLVNGYGPTEATTFTCCHRVAPSLTAESTSVPIGRPVDGMRVHVLDERMRPSPAGAPGGLWIGGEGLAIGYPGRPAQTAAAFLPDPWSSEPGARLYRSGDRACFLPTGQVEFLGRLDRQVKVRGFRVEPREVEAQLSQHPEIVSTAVVAPVDSSGDRRLVAYVVPRPGVRVEPARLRELLGAHLPSYLMPSVFVPLDRLPMTASGKV